MTPILDEKLEVDKVYLATLNELVHCIECLKRDGYIVEPPTDQELAKRNRCRLCLDKLTKKARPRLPKPNSKGEGSKNQSQTAKITEITEDLESVSLDPDDRQGKKKKEPKPKCNYHGGKFERGRYQCCNATSWEKGCLSALEHAGEFYNERALRDRFNFVRTPVRNPGNDRLPNGRRLPRVRVAVALDCEMGTAWDRESELIRITMVDYFTGEVLIDSLVMPGVRMLNYNTRYSGVRWADLKKASSEGRVLNSYHNARREVFKHVDPNTIVVLHGGKSDLTSLRWLHHRIVDSSIVEATRKGGADSKGLKELANNILHRKIQTGRDGHDSLEDAIATRDLVHYYVVKRMEEEAERYPV